MNNDVTPPKEEPNEMAEALSRSAPHSGGAPVVRGANLADVISPLFKASLPPAIWSMCAERVQFTTDLSMIRRALGANARSAEAKLTLLLEGESVSFLSARLVERGATQ